MDRTHNPEFTNLEFYVAYKDYNWMMNTTEKLLEKVATDLYGDSKVNYGDNTIEFKGPYKKISILDSIKENTGFDLSNSSEEETFKIAKELGVEVDETMGKENLLMKFLAINVNQSIYNQPS